MATTLGLSGVMLLSHYLFFGILFARLTTLHAAMVSQSCQPPSAARASASWHTPLQTPEGIALARELMAAHLEVAPAVSVADGDVAQLLSKLQGTWKAQRYEHSEEKFKAQGWGWAVRKIMANAPCELGYTSAGGTDLACTFSSAGLLETSETLDLASQRATEKEEAGRVTSCYTTLNEDGTMLLNLQQGYLSAEARAADDVAYKQLTRYSVDDASAQLTLTEVTLTPGAAADADEAKAARGAAARADADAGGGSSPPPKVTRSWTHMVRARRKEKEGK